MQLVRGPPVGTMFVAHVVSESEMHGSETVVMILQLSKSVDRAACDPWGNKVAEIL